MVSQEKEVRYASQIIIRDKEWIFYFEKNNHLDCISFWWWEKESWDTGEFDTALRELREELWITFEKKELQIIDIDGPREFPKWIFISTLFLLRINNDVVKKVKENIKTILFTIKDIEASEEKFVLWKEKFLARCKKAWEI